MRKHILHNSEVWSTRLLRQTDFHTFYAVINPAGAVVGQVRKSYHPGNRGGQLTRFSPVLSEEEEECPDAFYTTMYEAVHHVSEVTK